MPATMSVTGPAAAAIAPPTVLITAPRPPAEAIAGARAVARPTTAETTGASAPMTPTAPAMSPPTAATTAPMVAARPGFCATHSEIRPTMSWMNGATVWIAETITPPSTSATGPSPAMRSETTGASAPIAAPRTGPSTEARVPAKVATEPNASARAGICGASASTPARTPWKNMMSPDWKTGFWKASLIACSATEPISPARTMMSARTGARETKASPSAETPGPSAVIALWAPSNTVVSAPWKAGPAMT